MALITKNYLIKQLKKFKSIILDEAYATKTQGQKADNAVQSVKIGTKEYKIGTNVTLPDYPTALPASDVKDWAKADEKPTYTADEVGAISNTVTHLSGDIASSEKGTANGVATLGSDGKVPSAQLPSYVDDVEEYTSKDKFPEIGESGKIYIDTTSNHTYRWSGSTYVEISSSLALGETSSTAYAGDKGKAVADSLADHEKDTNIHITSAEREMWNKKQDASTAITTSNISSQSVKYATTAGSAPANGGNSNTVNGHTVESDVPSDAKFTDTNTWRGIQNNLTSDSTTDSLSAAQGKVLKGLVDEKASSSHTHNDIYYTETEMDTKLSAKLNVQKPAAYDVFTLEKNTLTNPYLSVAGTKSTIKLENGNITTSTINSGTPITSSNIGSQSVNYASTAGSAPASDVKSWAKASSKPTYTASEVGALPLSGGILTSGNNKTHLYPTGINIVNSGDTSYSTSLSYKSLSTDTINVTTILTTSGNELHISGGQEINNPNPDGGIYLDSQDVFYLRNLECLSSKKYKENIEYITDEQANRILELKPCEFDYKRNGFHSYGLIAEETYDILPEIVKLKNGEPDAISYITIIPFLIKEIQILKSEIDSLKNELETKQ